MSDQLWIEPVGDIIIARLRGVLTEDLLRECHERILALAEEVGHGRVLFDGLEMEPPPVEVPILQWKLDQKKGSMNLKRAIVVPNTRLAYLARIAFGESDVRVFYNDMSSAVIWLTQIRSGNPAPAVNNGNS